MCPDCGGPQPQGARYCVDCGNPLAGAESSAQDSPPKSPLISTGPRPVKTIEFLGNVPIFTNLKPDVLGYVTTQMLLISVAEGPIFREGDAVDGLYVINAGKAKVTTSAEGGGSEAVLAILGEGDSFGEVGLVDGLPRSANVIAMGPMECFYLGRAVFLTVLDAHPEMAISIIRALASMVRNADEWVSRTI